MPLCRWMPLWVAAQRSKLKSGLDQHGDHMEITGFKGSEFNLPAGLLVEFSRSGPASMTSCQTPMLPSCTPLTEEDL